MIEINDPRIAIFLKAWHESGRKHWHYEHLDYDTDQAKSAHDRNKYIALDVGSGVHRSGMYLLEKETGLVFVIKSKYGVPNRKKCLGTIEQATNKFCTHNAMVETGNPNYAWKCADCGYVYGS